MANLLSTLTKPVEKNIPKASNIPTAMMAGAGSYAFARFFDNTILSGAIQSMGITLPIFGRLSLLDVIMVGAFKGAFRKNTLVLSAWAGDRVLIAGRSLASLIPSFGKQGNTPNPTVANSGQTGGF